MFCIVAVQYTQKIRSSQAQYQTILLYMHICICSAMDQWIYTHLQPLAWWDSLSLTWSRIHARMSARRDQPVYIATDRVLWIICDISPWRKPVRDQIQHAFVIIQQRCQVYDYQPQFVWYHDQIQISHTPPMYIVWDSKLLHDRAYHNDVVWVYIIDCITHISSPHSSIIRQLSIPRGYSWYLSPHYPSIPLSRWPLYRL